MCQRKTFFHHFSLFSLFSLSLSRSSRANLPGKNSEWATASSQTRPRSSSAQPGASTSRTRPEGRGSRRQACRRSMAVAASSPFTTGAPARPCGASPVGSPCRRGRSRQRYEILVALDCRSEYASLFLPAGERGKEKGSDSQSWSQKKKLDLNLDVNKKQPKLENSSPGPTPNSARPSPSPPTTAPSAFGSKKAGPGSSPPRQRGKDETQRRQDAYASGSMRRRLSLAASARPRRSRSPQRSTALASRWAGGTAS